MEPPADVAGATAADPEVPVACQVSTARQPPLAVTFRFSNQQSGPVFLRSPCGPLLSIASCASGYSDDIAPTGSSCMCHLQSCPVGGACDTSPRTIAPGGSLDVPWDGRFLVTVRQAGRECHEDRLAVAARYRVSALVFRTAADASRYENPFATIQAEFGLGTTDVVELPIKP